MTDYWKMFRWGGEVDTSFWWFRKCTLPWEQMFEFIFCDLCADLVHVWKKMHNLSCNKSDELFHFRYIKSTRGHELNFSVPRCRLNFRQQFFSVLPLKHPWSLLSETFTCELYLSMKELWYVTGAQSYLIILNPFFTLCSSKSSVIWPVLHYILFLTLLISPVVGSPLRTFPG